MIHYQNNINNISIESHNNIKNTFSKSSKDYLIKQCTEIAIDSFGSDAISEEDVCRHILDSYTTIIARDEQSNVIGFSSSDIKNAGGFHIIYFQSTVIANHHKRTGLHKIFLALRIIEGVKRIKSIGKCNDENQILLGGRTQNPRISRRSRKSLDLFPNLDGFIDEKIRPVGRIFAHSLYEDDCKHSPYGHPSFIFDDETFVAKSAYKFASNKQGDKASLYDNNIPFSSDSKVDEFMKTRINWENGDALISLGFYKNDKVRELLDESKQILARYYSKTVSNDMSLVEIDSIKRSQ